MKNLLFLVLLSIAVFNGFAFYKTGNLPLRTWGEQVASDGLEASLKHFSLKDMFNKTKQDISEITGTEAPASGPQKLQISKWTDAQGVVHYDNKPVPGAATISINPNANVLPMEDAPAAAPAEKPEGNLNQEVQENRERMRREMEARMGI